MRRGSVLAACREDELILIGTIRSSILCRFESCLLLSAFSRYLPLHLVWTNPNTIMKEEEIRNLIEKFDEKYHPHNPNAKFHKRIKALLKTPEGMFLIAGIGVWLKKELSTPLTPLGKGE
jgi:hypothetical protein